MEVLLNLIPLQTATSTWSTRITFAKSKSKITSLPVPAFLRSGYQTGAFWIATDSVPGFSYRSKSPTELWGNDTVPGSMAAFLAGQPITLAPRPIGEMTPKFTMGIANDISYKAFKFYALWDWQNGGMLAAGTWRHGDLSLNSPDHDIVNPVTGVKIGKERVDWYRQVTAVFFKDASYLKLREVQLNYEVPTSVVKKIWSGARFVRIGVSGRNLLQITPYRGGDPEASTFAANATDGLALARELGAYPPSRSYWFNLELGF